MERAPPDTGTTRLEDWIRSEAVRLGFDRVGITSAEPLVQAGERLASWIDAGMHAGMSYMATHASRRSRPADLLPGARSAIVTLTRYQARLRHDASRTEPLAAYAVRPDYHQVLKSRLRELARRIDERLGGASYRLAVDTAPLLEKALAERAGLGWIGKSTNLVHEEMGCHTLIGTILIDRPLRKDTPARNRCGTCNRCIEACPTEAFVAPYRLDARRCLSYWTIEHRGPFPAEMRARQGGRLFGCDACLDACPFGRRRRDQDSPGLPTDPDLSASPLVHLVRVGQARFKKTFGHTPIPRALKRGFLRNAASALAHEAGRAGASAPGHASLRAMIEPLLGAGDAAVREHATWALGRLGPGPSRDRLRRALEQESDERTARVMRDVLACPPTGSTP